MMKKVLFLLSVLFFGISFGAVYLVPSWWHGIANSVRSSDVIVLSTSAPYSYTVQNIPSGAVGTILWASYRCQRISKISCDGNGSPRVYGQVIGYVLVDDRGNALSPSSVDLRAVDRGNSFDICGAIGGSDGLLYLATNCNPSNGCGASSNSSYLIATVYQVCK